MVNMYGQTHKNMKTKVKFFVICDIYSAIVIGVKFQRLLGK